MLYLTRATLGKTNLGCNPENCWKNSPTKLPVFSQRGKQPYFTPISFLDGHQLPFFRVIFWGGGFGLAISFGKNGRRFLKKVETTLAPSLLVKQPPGIFFSAQTSSRFIVGGCGCVAGDWNLVPGAARLAGVVFPNLCRVVFFALSEPPGNHSFTGSVFVNSRVPKTLHIQQKTSSPSQF